MTRFLGGILRYVLATCVTTVVGAFVGAAVTFSQIDGPWGFWGFVLLFFVPPMAFVAWGVAMVCAAPLCVVFLPIAAFWMRNRPHRRAVVLTVGILGGIASPRCVDLILLGQLSAQPWGGFWTFGVAGAVGGFVCALLFLAFVPRETMYQPFPVSP